MKQKVRYGQRSLLLYRVPSIKILVFFAQHRPERDRHCNRIIILLSLGMVNTEYLSKSHLNLKSLLFYNILSD